uniref:Uncharacterized protein n=1 Tax=Photinus pyralis TaxID=7054 RepID=A0A1Y1LQB2_PHOPY
MSNNMQKSPHLPRFHSSLVYQKPTQLHSLEVLRNVCPYFEDKCDFEIRRDKTDGTTKGTSACDIWPLSAVLERKNESVQTWNARYESDLFFHDLNEVEDYGAETRDFIISRLETPPAKISCLVSHNRCTDATSSGINSHQTVMRDLEEPQGTDCSKAKSPEISTIDGVSELKPSTMHSRNNSIDNCLTCSRPHSPKVSRRSKLPVKKRSASVDSSSRQTQVKDVKTKISHLSGTRWFNDCQNLSFTKKMTSYSFHEHNIKKQKRQCSCNNTIFGYSVK